MVQIDGVWCFFLFLGDVVEVSLDYKIFVEADQPPVVVANVVGETSRVVDEFLGIWWQVIDDYGIVSVIMEIKCDGEIEVVELCVLIDLVVELLGGIRRTFWFLGLSFGDIVILCIVVIDSDKVFGGNWGESEEIVFEVFGFKGVGRWFTVYYCKLCVVLVIVLVDFFEEFVFLVEFV